uniref:Uncharacterized protein n=1 Tax=Triticum urartu TaxID=4572 RepID=A0A8R7U5P1_TRIUA
MSWSILVPKSCICLTIVLILGATLWTFGSRMASMAMECRRGMYCLMSFGSSVLPITYGLATYRFLGLGELSLHSPSFACSFWAICVG